MSNKSGINKTNLIMFALNNKAMLLLAVAFVCAIFITGGDSIAPYNLTSLLRQVPTYAIVAIGFTIIFASGQFDLSVGRIVSLCGVIYATLSLSMPLWAAVIGTLIAGMLLEFINAAFIRGIKLPGFVLTLATSEIYRGIAHIMTEGRNISGLSDPLIFIGQGLLFGVIPVAFIIALVLIILVAVMFNKTLYGRHIIATGGNGEAAKLSGIKTELIRVTSFMVAGLIFAAGSITLTGRVGFAAPLAGETYLMDCIAAVVIGGTSMHGGKAKVAGSLFGMGLIVVINNMLSLMGINTFWQWIAKGAIIILAISLDALSERFMNKQKTKAA